MLLCSTLDERAEPNQLPSTLHMFSKRPFFLRRKMRYKLSKPLPIIMLGIEATWKEKWVQIFQPAMLLINLGKINSIFPPSTTKGPNEPPVYLIRSVLQKNPKNRSLQPSLEPRNKLQALLVFRPDEYIQDQGQALHLEIGKRKWMNKIRKTRQSHPSHLDIKHMRMTIRMDLKDYATQMMMTIYLFS